jgi:hypothetical protein
MKIVQKSFFHGFIFFAQRCHVFRKAHKNISSHLYMHPMGFKHLTFVSKKYKPMKELVLHNFHYPIVGWEVFDVRKMN